MYLDDVIIKSHKCSNYVTYLKKFFDRLRVYNLKLNLVKCAFDDPPIRWLDSTVREKVIESNSSKKESIQDFPAPTTLRM